MSHPKLLCMYGLPRSGKTTICNDLAIDFPVVNQDNVRLALHGHRYAAKAEPFVRAITLVMVEALIRSGHPLVVLDETCYSRAKRDLMKSHLWDTFFFEVPTAPEVCKERAIATGQDDLIPVIDGMWARREPLGEDESKVEDLGKFLDEVIAEIMDESPDHFVH